MRKHVCNSNVDYKYQLDTFYDTMFLYTQDIQVVNFSQLSTGFVNVIITYKDVEGRSVKLEAMGNIDKGYVQT